MLNDLITQFVTVAWDNPKIAKKGRLISVITTKTGGYGRTIGPNVPI